MKIGVIGTGHVGTTLARGLADKGHDVMLGSRDPSQSRLTAWAAEDPSRHLVGSERDAANYGEVVIIAVPGRTLPAMLDETGVDPFDGTIIIDATNPVAHDATGRTVDAYGDDDSGAEYLQRRLPNAAVVKAFNQILWDDMLHPERSRIRILRIAGDDAVAKQTVTKIGEDFGWTVQDIGPLSEARNLEHAAVAAYS